MLNLSMASATSPGFLSSLNASGLNPTGEESVGSSTTTSSARSSGIQLSISFTKSVFGSIRRTLRPALMSAKIRCCIAVLLPLPVGPSSMVCSKESRGLILNFLGVASRLKAKLRPVAFPVGLLYQAGGSVRLGCKPGVPGSSSSPIGSSRKLTSSFMDEL